MKSAGLNCILLTRIQLAKMKTFALICILIFEANANSFDAMAEKDVIGKPISNEEIQASKGLNEDEKGNSLNIIEHAGHFEGDIIRSKEENRNAIINNNKKWPNAQIPYVISASYSARDRSVIANAIGIYQAKTCIRFKARTTETDYIHILNGGDGQCYSSVGRTGGRQVVSIGNRCAYTGIVLHEFMHAAGFWHEQSRTDRDQYVRINFQNVQAGLENNFRSYPKTQITDLNAPYDYCSIMHYSAYAFSKNRQPTITVLKSSSCVIGRANDFSEIDIKKLNTLYKCTGYPQITGGSTCTDKDQRCPGWASRYCNDAQYKQWMTQNCAKSCKSCEVVSTCTDKDQRCPGWASRYCNDARYKQWMTQNCAKSCNACEGGRTCQADKQSARNCTYWKGRGFCTQQYVEYMKANCDTTCNC